MKEFGANPCQSCARRRFVEDIAAGFWVSKWSESMGAELACGSGKTERDFRDFIYLAEPDQFEYWVFISPAHIGIPEAGAIHWDTITAIDSALLGGVLASRWIVMIRGDLSIPELQAGFGWRPLGAIGIRCLELNIALEHHNRDDKRISPISDSIGQFIYISDENGNKVTTNDPHIHSLTLSKVRRPPWVWPVRISGVVPLAAHVLIRVLGGMEFWPQSKGYLISEHIAVDALWRSTPTVLWYWVFQHYIKANGFG